MLAVYYFFISKVYAQGITNPVLTEGEAPPGEGADRLGQIVSGTIGIFFLFGFIMGFLHLIFGAYKWITAGGDKSQLEAARDRIVQAIVGLIVLAAIWGIMMAMSFFLGIGTSTPTGIEFNLPEFF